MCVCVCVCVRARAHADVFIVNINVNFINFVNVYLLSLSLFNSLKTQRCVDVIKDN